MGGESEFAIASYDYDDDRFKIGAFNAQPESRISIDAIPDAAMHKKTNEISPRIILATEQPHPSDSLAGIQAELLGTEQAVETLENWAAQETPPAFPNLAYEAIKAGLLKEEATRIQLNNHITKIKENQRKIDLLLQLSSEFASFGDKEGQISENGMKAIAELKEKGVELKIAGNKVGKQQVQEGKSLINSLTDQHRTKVQTSITIDVQTGMNNDNTMVQILQGLIREYTALIRKINENTGRQ